MELDGNLINLLTTEGTTHRALQQYLKHKEAQSKWYERNKEEIKAKKKAEYRILHPEVKKPGRPRKVVADPEVK